jgi:tRNA U34 5-methylaminomethyl-2-thiouridine-forming methyltransferase MnmC
MNRHEVHVFENGTASIRDLEAGETMHSQVGPDVEAKRVYIEQSGLADRLIRGSLPLVLYDVGMGIASNAVAAIDLAQSLAGCRPLHIISFENTLDGLKLALSDAARFPTQNRHREKLEALIENRIWKKADGSITWELRFGDFLNQELSPAPEVIFYDFYSPKSAPQLWTLQCFERLFSACEKRKVQGLSTVLTTYSAATFVRSALLLAGFSVGYGGQTEMKAETTIASTMLQDLKNPLGKPWLDRLLRSSKPLPIDVLPSQTNETLTKIQASSQFSLS